MFKALKENNMIVKIMGYRSIDLSKINDMELALLGNGDLSNIL